VEIETLDQEKMDKKVEKRYTGYAAGGYATTVQQTLWSY